MNLNYQFKILISPRRNYYTHICIICRVFSDYTSRQELEDFTDGLISEAEAEAGGGQ